MNVTALQLAEVEFRQRLDSLGQDARAAVRYSYAGPALNTLAAQRMELLEEIDRHAGFWNLVLGAVQTAAVVALGRIYDSRRDVLSASRLLAHTARYPGIFGADALTARKIAHGLTADQARTYTGESFLPAERDFASLRAALAEHTAEFDRSIGPVRDKVYAHTGRITREDLDRMYANVPSPSDFERLAVFPLRLHRSLEMLYRDGIKPDLPEAPTDIQEILRNPVGRRAVSWEHRHTVKEITEFLDTLTASS